MGCDLVDDHFRRHLVRHELLIMGKKVTYWEDNPHSLRTIVMLHGFRGSHDGLIDMVHHFSDYRLVLPDLPGYGESEPLATRHSLKEYAFWLDDFVKRLELSDFVAWGHSYGGSIALIHAVEGDEKPSILVSVSPAAIRRGPLMWMTTGYYRIGLFLPEPYRKRWLTSRTIDHITARLLFQTDDETQFEKFVKRRGRDLPTFIPDVITDAYLSSLGTDLEDYASRLTTPVLVIAGAKDIIVPLQRLRRLVSLMSNGVLEVMHDQGHLAPLERPSATARITNRFLDHVA
jgi:pimeloyl-ACP methyl ester carboxylesterase